MDYEQYDQWSENVRMEREEYVPDGLSMTVTLGVRLLNAVRDYIQE